ncbi:hypothetical protein, partial [Leptonema illini]|uniref:hypothetical protein n=1 Tax=Leptonema illini TaxID=183 RepID=UPI003CCC3BAC
IKRLTSGSRHRMHSVGPASKSNYHWDIVEYDATPEWWGDARGLVAGINTIGTFIADLIVLNIGTRLFGLHIMVNAIASAGDALARAVTPKYDLKVKSSISLKTPLFNVNASINMKLIDKSRFKNLNKISKWRL